MFDKLSYKVCYSIHGRPLFATLRYLKEAELQSFQRGIVLYAGREVVAFDVDMFALPLSMWWASQ